MRMPCDWRLAFCLAVLMTCACATTQAHAPVPLTAADSLSALKNGLPDSLGVITFLGESALHDEVTDRFAEGLKLMGVHTVRRIRHDGGPDYQTRVIAGEDEAFRTMWYYSLLDSIGRISTLTSPLKGIFVGSFAGIAVAVDENQERIIPTGILHVQLLEAGTYKTLWETEVQDRRIFPSTLDLRDSAASLVDRALERFREDMATRVTAPAAQRTHSP